MNNRPGIIGSSSRLWRWADTYPNGRLLVLGVGMFLMGRLANDSGALPWILAGLRLRRPDLNWLLLWIAIVGVVAFQATAIGLMLFGAWGAMRQRRRRPRTDVPPAQ